MRSSGSLAGVTSPGVLHGPMLKKDTSWETITSTTLTYPTFKGAPNLREARLRARALSFARNNVRTH